ncbi:MAG: hypothetical protein ACI94N_000736 [Candidatus Arcticimaribacter sp.]|jgi:uncharacterized protein YkwD|tara:strand:+ start:148 stop:675 length:528 start_codon:yes stop_codon:yes gene_type:complete
MKVIINKIFVALLFFSLLSYSKDSEVQEPDQVLYEAIAEKILLKTNAIRSSLGKSDLSQNDEMDNLATLHSKNMVIHDFFAHVDHENKTPSNRADDLSVSWSNIAENIGTVPWSEYVRGFGDTRSAEAISTCVLENWENSPVHYKNIIGDYSELGVGIAFTKDSIAFFTQVFRTP